MFVGKILFAMLGMHISGFIGQNPIGGLMFGVLIGHVVDIVLAVKIGKLKAKRHYEKVTRKAFNDHFLSSLFHMLGMLCAADGAIVKSEINEIESIIKERLKLSKADRRRAIKFFKAARNSRVPFQTSAVKYVELYQDHPEMLEGTLQLLMNVASADGKIKNEERRLLRAAATVFGIDETRYEQLGSNFLDVDGLVGDIEKSYALLGCAKEAPVAEIKKSYRKLVATYHPDKIMSKDLPEEFMQFANDKMKDIQDAYEMVKSDKGF